MAFLMDTIRKSRVLRKCNCAHTHGLSASTRVRMSRISVKEKLWSSIQRSQDNVFLRAEFDRFGAYRQVSPALRALVSEGLLLRVGYGTYVKTRPSSLFGKPVPADTLLNVAFAVMKKLGVKADVGRAAKALSRKYPTAIRR